MTLQVNGIAVVNLNRSITLGTATPGSPAAGLMRWNSSSSQFEVYNGIAWASITAGSASSPAWAWGTNGYGRLGDSTANDRSSPVSVVGGFTDWVQIDAGNSQSVALRANGTIWSWGGNVSGQLGDGTTVSKSSPVSVVGGFTDWTQISAGFNTVVALRANGTVWAWGSGDSGKIGDNTVSNRSSPVSVVGGFTDWIQVSAGSNHTAAIRANGTAWAWGRGVESQLGNNASTNRSSPVSVVGGFTDWIQIGAGLTHTVAIRSNGTAWAWGGNGYGRLGDNTLTNRSSPVSVVGGFTDWTKISAGADHTVALRANGTAWAWGYNRRGQLGNNQSGLYVGSSSPVSVVGGFTDWVHINAGGSHSVAIRSNGTAWAWGYNLGQLGDNSTVNRSSPVSVVGGFTDWVQISGGNGHTLALRSI